MRPATECPVGDLKPFVENSLDPDTDARIVDHLDECTDCRSRVDAIAGSPKDWSIVSEAFADEDAILSLSPADSAASNDGNGMPGRFDATALMRLMAPSEDPRAAGRIGPFEITGIVGTGGMGVVLKVRDPALDRFVAIKMLLPHLASSPNARKRFAREARAAAAVIHDNVIAIYQVAHWHDFPYLVMPYLAGPSLQQRIDEEGQLNIESVLTIGMQIARGLSAAHAQGLVHRDVKPANVLLAEGTERAVITDFGLARASDDASLTRAGWLTGTPHYMSPEQARGENVDARSDLFSLGSVLYTMLTGHPPVRHELGSETINAIALHRVPSLADSDIEVPLWMIRLVDSLHDFESRRRPTSAHWVADMLEQCLAHQRQGDGSPLPDELCEQTRASARMIAITCATAIALSLLIAGITYKASSVDSNQNVVVPQTQQRAMVSDFTERQHSTDHPEPSDVPTDWFYVDEQLQDIDRLMLQFERDLHSDWNGE